MRRGEEEEKKRGGKEEWRRGREEVKRMMMMKIFKYIGYNEHFNIKYIRKGHFCNSKYQNHTLKYFNHENINSFQK